MGDTWLLHRAAAKRVLDTQDAVNAATSWLHRSVIKTVLDAEALESIVLCGLFSGAPLHSHARQGQRLLHPDINREEGAEDAFKKFGNGIAEAESRLTAEDWKRLTLTRVTGVEAIKELMCARNAQVQEAVAFAAQFSALEEELQELDRASMPPPGTRKRSQPAESTESTDSQCPRCDRRITVESLICDHCVAEAKSSPTPCETPCDTPRGAGVPTAGRALGISIELVFQDAKSAGDFLGKGPIKGAGKGKRGKADIPLPAKVTKEPVNMAAIRDACSRKAAGVVEVWNGRTIRETLFQYLQRAVDEKDGTAYIWAAWRESPFADTAGFQARLYSGASTESMNPDHPANTKASALSVFHSNVPRELRGIMRAGNPCLVDVDQEASHQRMTAYRHPEALLLSDYCNDKAVWRASVPPSPEAAKELFTSILYLGSVEAWRANFSYDGPLPARVNGLKEEVMACAEADCVRFPQLYEACTFLATDNNPKATLVYWLNAQGERQIAEATICEVGELATVAACENDGTCFSTREKSDTDEWKQRCLQAARRIARTAHDQAFPGHNRGGTCADGGTMAGRLVYRGSIVGGGHGGPRRLSSRTHDWLHEEPRHGCPCGCWRKVRQHRLHGPGHGQARLRSGGEQGGHLLLRPPGAALDRQLRSGEVDDPKVRGRGVALRFGDAAQAAVLDGSRVPVPSGRGSGRSPGLRPGL
jgi:hypothetical protein